MSTKAQLLAAIIAEPDEDTPRLAYADFLQENDEPERADLIRAQCEYARLPNWDVQAKELRHQIRVLLARHSDKWYAELGEIQDVTWGAFDRGFVNAVRVPSLQVFRKSAGALRAVAPVEHVTFTKADSTATGKKEAFPWVRGIRLAFRYEFRADRFKSLLESGIAENLRVLDLTNVGVENAGAEVIAKAKHLTQLEELDFTNCFVGVNGTTALTEAKHLSTLRTVRFSSYGSGYVDDPFLNDEGVALLTAKQSCLKNLTRLELGQNQLSADSVNALLTSPCLAKLETVSLRHCAIGEGAFTAAAGNARWKELDISVYQLKAGTVQAMAKLPQLSTLVRLCARGSGLAATDLEAIANSKFAPELRELHLARNDIDSERVTILAGGKWKNLHTLDLQHNKITSAGAHYLGKGRFPALAELRINNNELGDDGAKAIASASWASSLRRLLLGANNIGSAGAESLAKSKKLQNLTELNLQGNDIGISGLSALASADWPNLTDLELSQPAPRTPVRRVGAFATPVRPPDQHAETKPPVGDDLAALLARAPFFGRLLELSLAYCDLTPAGLQLLVDAGSESLRKLVLDNNKRLGPESLVILAKASGLPALRHLSIASCQLDGKALEAFVESAFVSQLRRLTLHGNTQTQALHERVRKLQWGDLGPGWITEDSVEDEDW
jgi:uncharacterized protein (TIGR02996 family)